MPRSKHKFDAVQERRLSEGIATGALPEAPPNQMWGGRGTEQPCEICGHPIAPSTVEFELDLPTGRQIRVDLGCLRRWQRYYATRPDSAEDEEA